MGTLHATYWGQIEGLRRCGPLVLQELTSMLRDVRVTGSIDRRSYGLDVHSN